MHDTYVVLYLRPTIPHFHSRLVEEVKDLASISLENEEVYMNTLFEDFTNLVILKTRGHHETETVEFTPVSDHLF